jgi:hypothetical protein
MNYTYQVFFFSPNFVISKIFNLKKNKTLKNKIKKPYHFLGQKPAKFVEKETMIAIV